MMIKGIDIRAFGKFKNLRLPFAEGINVIEGENESGKTTVHAFIEGVLYGFVKPGQKRRTYLDDHARYQPKDSDDYGGSILVEHEGNTYRIRRDLRKSTKNPITVTNDKTGEDITNQLPKDDVTKAPDLGAFFDIPYTLYTNTLSVRQLEGKTDEAVAAEVISRANNLLASGSETFNPMQAIDNLTSERDRIGTDKAPTRPYAKAVAAVKRLERERDDIYEAHAETLTLKTSLESLRQDHETHREELTAVTKALEAKRNARRKASYKKASAINTMIEEKARELKALESYADFDADAVEQYLHASHAAAAAFDQITQLTADIEALEEKRNNLADGVSIEDPSRIIADRQRYNEALRKHDEEACQAAEATHERFITIQSKTRDRIRRLTHARAWLKTRWYFVVTLIAWVCLMPCLALQRKRAKKIERRVMNAAKERKEACAAKATIQAIETQHNVASPAAFEALYERALKAQSNQERIQELDEALNAKNEALNSQKEKHDAAKATMHALHQRHHVDSLEGLKRIRDANREYHTAKKELDTLKMRLEDALAGDTLEALADTVDLQSEDVPYDDIDDVMEAREALTSKLNDLRVSMERLNQRIESIEASHRPLETVEHELNQQIIERDRLSLMRDRHQHAIDMVKRAVAKIEENFAPVLSKKIGDYVHAFTGGNYRDIRVKKTMSFSAYDDRSGDFEAPMHFSRGTLDQIYFALRVGLLEALGKARLPLLLDDAFVAYDDTRLKETLKILDGMRDVRQILVFTCHDRERLFTSELSIPANRITLDET